MTLRTQSCYWSLWDSGTANATGLHLESHNDRIWHHRTKEFTLKSVFWYNRYNTHMVNINELYIVQSKRLQLRFITDHCTRSPLDGAQSQCRCASRNRLLHHFNGNVWLVHSVCTVLVLTHPLQVERGLPAELLLRPARVRVARGNVSTPAGGDLIRDLHRRTENWSWMISQTPSTDKTPETVFFSHLPSGRLLHSMDHL